MVNKSLTLLALVQVLLLLITGVQKLPVDYYEEGKREYEQGEIKKALNIWLEAPSKISAPDKIDPRIGFDFLKVVSENKMSNLYQSASYMYYWALDTEAYTDHSTILETEVKRLLPLMTEKKVDKMLSLLKDDPKKVTQQIKVFWLRMDPTPGTLINERLLEHWERIAYIQENFTENKNSVYQTDDRGPVFIKYGKPDVIESGEFDFQDNEVRNWVIQMFEFSNTTGQSSIGSLSRRDSASTAAATGQSFQNNQSIVRNIVNKAYTTYQNSEYEIWVYKNMSNTGSLVFLFGRDATYGDFGLRKSVEDFIPLSAFSQNAARKNYGIPPGFLYQLSFYEQLSSVDPYFYTAFNNLERGILTSSVSRGWAYGQRGQNSQALVRKENTSPNERSTYLSRVEPMDVESRQYLLYDDEGNPEFLTVFDSYPHSALLKNIYSTQDFSDEDLKKVSLRHAVQIYSLENSLIKTYMDQPQLVLESSEVQYPAQTLMRIPFIGDEVEQIFTSQLFYDQRTQIDGLNNGNILPSKLKASGEEVLQQGNPKSIDDEGLEMGELMIGFPFDESVTKREEFPFLISINNEIPKGYNLFIHYELYNLQKNEEGIAQFNIDYQIKEKKFLKIFRRPESSLSLNFETLDKNYREDLEIELADLPPGDYELNFVVTDRVTEESREQKIDFKITPTDLVSMN